jgi:hypothetical protein
MVKETLMAKANRIELKPKVREEALRCIEAIELFERAENAFGLRQLPLSEPPRFKAMDINGVALSVQPDFLIRTVERRPRLGAVMLRLAKTPDPQACRLEETQRRRGEHRREMARYLNVMMEMVLEDQAPGQGAIDRDLIFVADIRLGERIETAGDHVARRRAVRSACGHIARLWGTVTPRASILRRPA